MKGHRKLVTWREEKVGGGGGQRVGELPLLPDTGNVFSHLLPP